MINRKRVALACAGVMLGLATSAKAQQLVYTPINPMFGGNPGNASQLESDANTQNPFKATASNANLTQSQLFAQQLQSQLLADLANQVSQAIFGPNAQPSGTFSFGGESVTFNRGLGEITVTITDPTGSQTTIQLPTSSATSTTGAN
ncbi:MAG TPA: curli assembly protein CsgF [Caulobacteraceae bacterium]|jgi:curli production assembly/transport component CsgF